MKKFERRNTTLLLLLAGFLIIAAVVAHSNSTAQKPVGMILDTTGSPGVKSTGSERRRKLIPMDTIKTGDLIDTTKNSTVTLVLFATNEEFILHPSTQAKISQNQVEKISGNLAKNKTTVALNLPKNSLVSSRRIMGETLHGDAKRPAKLPPKSMTAAPRPRKAKDIEEKGIIGEARPPAPAPPAPSKPEFKISNETAEKVISRDPSTVKPSLSIDDAIEETPPEPHEIIVLYPADTSRALGQKLTLSWNFPEKQRPDTYIAVLKETDPGGKTESVIYAADIGLRTSVTYPADLLAPLKPEKLYKLIVYGEFKNNTTHWRVVEHTSTFEVVSGETEKIVLEGLKEITSAKEPATPSLVKLFLICLENRLYAEALKFSSVLEKRIPDNPNINEYLVFIHENMGNREEAERYRKKISRKNDQS